MMTAFLKKRAWIAVLTLAALLGGLVFHSSAAHAASGGAMGSITVETDWSEDAQRMVQLIEGPLPTSFFFSYSVPQTFQSMKLCCETYADGEKTGEEVLLEHDFHESLADEPRRGEIFIGGYGQRIRFTEYYTMENQVYDAAGNVVEELAGPEEVFCWGEGSFPQRPVQRQADEGERWLYYHAWFSQGTSDDGALSFPVPAPGEPVPLMIYGEMPATERFRMDETTAEEFMADPELMAGSNYFYLFFCVFE